MRFELNVTPLKNAMDLGIINSNISKFFEKSTVIELTAEENSIRLNTQATSLISESIIPGNNIDKGTASAIVDCVLFKQLISTLDSNEVVLDFEENSLLVQSGRSKFTIPKLLNDEDGASLDRPVVVGSDGDAGFRGELHPSVWKYIQDHQLYAVAMSQIHKAYTRVWMSDKGVLTGDPATSFFTYQPDSDLDDKCLVSSTIVNLLSTLDEGTKIYKVDDVTYVVSMDTDSFKFCSQFTVDHEDESGIGVYDSDIIFDMVFDDSQSELAVMKNKMSVNIKQANLFSSASNPYVSVKAGSDGVFLVNDNINCKICKDASDVEYDITFTVSDLDSVVSHMDDDEMTLSPIIKGEDNEVFGIRFTSGKLVALIGGVD